MTNPSITYGHGKLDDCNDASDYTTETLTNMLAADATLTVLHGDIFQIEAKFDDGATEENVFYENATALNVNHILYNKWLLHYKTSESSGGAKAKVEVRFQDATTETLLDSAYSSGGTWATASGTIAKATSELDYIRFYADDDGTDGTFYVYYDFLLLHKGTFTFPFVAPGGITLELPNRYVDLEIPGRVGDITQYLGMKSPIIRLRGTMDTNTDWGVPDGEYLYHIWHEAHNDPWQWFSTGGLSASDRLINCKVTPRDLSIGMDSDSKTQRTWTATFKKYLLSCGSETTWADKQWFGI